MFEPVQAGAPRRRIPNITGARDRSPGVGGPNGVAPVRGDRAESVAGPGIHDALGGRLAQALRLTERLGWAGRWRFWGGVWWQRGRGSGGRHLCGRGLTGRRRLAGRRLRCLGLALFWWESTSRHAQEHRHAERHPPSLSHVHPCLGLRPRWGCPFTVSSPGHWDGWGKTHQCPCCVAGAGTSRAAAPSCPSMPAGAVRVRAMRR